MKIIITEKQADKLFGERIKCKCGHSWKTENKDKHPYLCHMCGWSQKSKNYNLKELYNFWNKELKKM
jgi:hypothetical protein